MFITKTKVFTHNVGLVQVKFVYKIFIDQIFIRGGKIGAAENFKGIFLAHKDVSAFSKETSLNTGSCCCHGHYRGLEIRLPVLDCRSIDQVPYKDTLGGDDDGGFELTATEVQVVCCF